MSSLPSPPPPTPSRSRSPDDSLRLDVGHRIILARMDDLEAAKTSLLISPLPPLVSSPSDASAASAVRTHIAFNVADADQFDGAFVSAHFLFLCAHGLECRFAGHSLDRLVLQSSAAVVSFVSHAFLEDQSSQQFALTAFCDRIPLVPVFTITKESPRWNELGGFISGVNSDVCKQFPTMGALLSSFDGVHVRNRALHAVALEILQRVRSIPSVAENKLISQPNSHITDFSSDQQANLFAFCKWLAADLHQRDLWNTNHIETTANILYSTFISAITIDHQHVSQLIALWNHQNMLPEFTSLLDRLLRLINSFPDGKNHHAASLLHKRIQLLKPPLTKWKLQVQDGKAPLVDLQSVRRLHATLVDTSAWISRLQQQQPSISPSNAETDSVVLFHQLHRSDYWHAQLTTVVQDLDLGVGLEFFPSTQSIIESKEAEIEQLQQHHGPGKQNAAIQRQLSRSQLLSRFLKGEALPANSLQPPPHKVNDSKHPAFIGQGGFGLVYKAKMNGVCVAIKKLAHQQLQGSKATDFLEEGQMLANLHHPNIVASYGVCTEPGEQAIVMELVDGRDLFCILHDFDRFQHLTQYHICRIAHQVALALQYLHQHKVIHRDIKSLNVLVSRQSLRVVVCDFGQAKTKVHVRTAAGSTYNPHLHPNQSNQDSKGADSSFVREKMAVSVRWSAPEVLLGDPVFSPACDVWSFGMLMYELVSGQIPYSSQTIDAVVIDAIKQGKLPSPKFVIAEKCPKGWLDLMNKCLSLEAKDRSLFPFITATLSSMMSNMETDQGIDPEKASSELSQLLFAMDAPLIVDASCDDDDDQKNTSRDDGSDSDQIYKRAMKFYRSGQTEKAAKRFQLLADEKHPGGCFRLAMLHRRGISVHEDESKAKELLKVVLDAKENESDVYHLAVAMKLRDDEDYKSAFDKFIELAQKGDDEGQIAVGWLYDNGKGVTQDYKQAMEWYLKAAAQGHAQALNNIGLLYDNGKGVAQDYKQAMDWYEKAAAQGHADAQFNIGVLYHNGEGVTQDYKQAMKWFEKAAAQGDADAQFNIGVLYHNGEGVTQDFKQAMEWYSKAAAQGYAEAQFNIGLFYHKGRGVTQDFKQAMEWFLKAAAQEHAGAQFYIGVLYHNGEGVTQDFKQAMEWYSKAAAQGHADAQFNIGLFYHNGKGVTQDYKQAMEWYSKAAAQRHAQAQFNIGVLCDNGEGVTQDFKQAMEWYSKAAAQGHAEAGQRLRSLRDVKKCSIM